MKKTKVIDIDNIPWLLPNPIEESLENLDLLPIPILAVFYRRGFTTKKLLTDFLTPPPPPDPLQHFPGLDKAVKRLMDACLSKEKVAICGDYDADGMTSTALLINVLRDLNVIPIASIPNRKIDGYGLNEGMVNSLYSQGVRLIITVDNGINAKKAIDLATNLGMEVIITDHHELPKKLPEVLSIIHPFLTPDDSPYRTLAGVGLAYILALALCNQMNAKQTIDLALDLYCIGTIADMANVNGANRYLLKKGLKQLKDTQSRGLQALYKIAGLENKVISVEDIGFQIAPRINAVGRIGDPKLIIDLLVEDDQDRSKEIAETCDELNKERKKLCKHIEEEVISLLEADKAIQPFILLGQSHWHNGVVGIVASRIVERYRYPVALLAPNEENQFRGSVRAPSWFSVNESLTACSEELINFGGHKAAGGFTVSPQQMNSLHEKLINISRTSLSSGLGIEGLKPEALLALSDISYDLWYSLQQLQPYGIGNSEPLFWSRRCTVIKQSKLKGGHLSLTLEQDGFRIKAIQWRTSLASSIPNTIDIVYHIRLNNWANRNSLQLEIKGFRAYKDQVYINRNGRRYKCSVNSDGIIFIENETQASISSTDFGEKINLKDLRPEDSKFYENLFAQAKVALGLSI